MLTYEEACELLNSIIQTVSWAHWEKLKEVDPHLQGYEMFLGIEAEKAEIPLYPNKVKLLELKTKDSSYCLFYYPPNSHRFTPFLISNSLTYKSDLVFNDLGGVRAERFSIKDRYYYIVTMGRFVKAPLTAHEHLNAKLEVFGKEY